MVFDRLINKQSKLVVVGLGYVGLPIAVEFAKKIDVIGFDIDSNKIHTYKSGVDITSEVGDDELLASSIYLTSDEREIKKGSFIIVAVPTPIKPNKEPDLSLIESACQIIGRNLSKDSIVVFESTVYPGVTEEFCIPILEKLSGLKATKDFGVGYSPERINPGDRQNRVDNIVKIVSGINEYCLDEIEKVYSIVVKGGIHRVSTIKTAEATKLAENTQRDINIAFMNELAMFFDKAGIQTSEVIEAMNTKWNSLKFSPGLVGGHCIGVDPYYFIYEASRLNFKSSIVSASRKLNDEMSQFIAEITVKRMIKVDKRIKGSRVWVLGLTFKEDCPDIRNTKVVDIIKSLEDYGIEVVVSDPHASKNDAFREYGIKLVETQEVSDVDTIIFAVGHSEFKQIPIDKLEKYYKKSDESKVLIDIKSILDSKKARELGFDYWSL